MIVLIITLIVTYLVYSAAKYSRNRWTYTILAFAGTLLFAPVVLQQFAVTANDAFYSSPAPSTDMAV